MYTKRMMLIISLLASINLFANTCSIEFVSQKNDNYHYMVNGKDVVVEHSKGIANLLIAYEKTTARKHRGIVKKNSICLNLSENCVDVYANGIKGHIQLFLEGNFCLGEQK